MTRGLQTTSLYENGDLTKQSTSKVADFNSIIFLGISTVIGGHFSVWNAGLLYVGFWDYFGAVVFIGSGYVALTLCVAEMAAALPFSGGTYGLARVTLGKLPGYLIGSCETIEYVVYVAMSAEAIGSLLTEIVGISSSYEPLYWLGFYILAIGLNVSPSKYLWTFVPYISSFILAIACVYCAMSPTQSHFERNIDKQHISYRSHENHAYMFFRALPYSAWFFVGIETLSLACSDTVQANKTIPKASLVVMLLSFALALAILFASSAMTPRAMLSDTLTPMTDGFSAIFKISDSSSIIFTLIAKFGAAFGFMFAYGRQMAALQKSKLLLTFVTNRFGEEYCLHSGLVVGSVFGFTVILFIWLFRHSYMLYLENACLMGSFVAYIGIFASYFVFRWKFSNLAKHYRSPLGLYGAVYGSVVFALAFICLATCQKDNGMSILLFAVFVSFMTANYFVFSVNSQIYSAEEQAVLFIAYVMKANVERRQRVIQRMEHRYAAGRMELNSVNSKRLERSERHSSHTDLQHDSDHGTSTEGVATRISSQIIEGDSVRSSGETTAAGRRVTLEVNIDQANELGARNNNNNGVGGRRSTPSTPGTMRYDEMEALPAVHKVRSPTAGDLKGTYALPPNKTILPALTSPATGRKSLRSDASPDPSLREEDESVGDSSNARRRSVDSLRSGGGTVNTGQGGRLSDAGQTPGVLTHATNNNSNNNENGGNSNAPILRRSTAAAKAVQEEEDRIDMNHYLSEMPHHLQARDKTAIDELIVNLYGAALLSYQRLMDGLEDSTEGKP